MGDLLSMPKEVGQYVGLNEVISQEQFDEIVWECDNRPPV